MPSSAGISGGSSSPNGRWEPRYKIMAPTPISAITTTPPTIPPTMAATGAGLSVGSGPGVAVFAEPVAVPLRGVIAKDSIVDKLAF